MALLAVVAAVLNALFVAVVVRRVLGAPVGWPRTILLSMVAASAANPMLRWLFGILGMDPDATVSGSDSGYEVGLVAVIALAWLIALEVALLALLEVIVPTGSLPSPLAVARSLPSRRRRVKRYFELARVASKHGLAAYLRPRAQAPSDSSSRVARSLRLALTDAGVSFVKLGQMLGTRPDLVSPAYLTELSRLHSDVPAEPWETVRPVIEEELGRPLDEVFESIDPVPFAAASVAQVHDATLSGGARVVVKVQRPAARRQVVADLDIMGRLAAWLDRRTAWGRDLGVADLAAGFASSLNEELDYTVELANMHAVAATTELDGEIPVRVPRTFDDLCSSRILVIERLDGKPVTSALADLAKRTADERQAMAEALLGTVLRQVVVHGTFHADLHPGNIFVDADGGFTLLDFGAVGRLDQSSRHALGSLLMAVERQDSASATDSLLTLLDRPDQLDDRALERELGQLLVQYGGNTPGHGTAALFAALFRMLLRHRLRVPPQVAAAFRALGALEGTLTAVSPDLDLMATGRSQGRAMMAAQLSPHAVRSELEGQLGALLPMLQRLPRRVDRISQQLEDGRLSVNVSLLSGDAERRFLTGLVQQGVTAFLAAALALCGIALLIANSGPQVGEHLHAHALVGSVLLLFGFVLGARALVLTFRQDG